MRKQRSNTIIALICVGWFYAGLAGGMVPLLVLVWLGENRMWVLILGAGLGMLIYTWCFDRMWKAFD